MDRPAPEEAETADVAAPDHPREPPTPLEPETPVAPAAELALAERMHALGFLADGIAHDIANPLGAILAFASLLAADERIPADLRTDARLLRDEADRTYRMVSTLLELARTHPPSARPIAIEPVISGMLELAAYRLAGVEVEVDLPAGLPEAEADPAAVRQSVAAALVEAIEALGWPDAHGRLRIAGSMVAGAGRRILRLELTTDASSRTVVDLPVHDGSVTGPRDPADGATDARLTTGAHPDDAVTPPVVLVCDDESSVRALLGRVLERAGCEAIEAASGEAALLLVETTVIDAVVSDHRLPGMTGIDLFERASALRPDLATRFVLLSGDADDPDIAAFTRATGVPVLAKPFDLASIEAAVRRVVIPVAAP
jgi:CheY-like chemotaxis protein